jgi:hypothetical protein
MTFVRVIPDGRTWRSLHVQRTMCPQSQPLLRMQRDGARLEDS